MGKRRRVLVDEFKQVVAADAVGYRRPVAPAVRRCDDGPVSPPVQGCILFVAGFQVVEKLEEHHPSQQWQAVGVAVQPLVFAQCVAGRLDQGGKLLGGGLRRLGLGLGVWVIRLVWSY